MNRVLLNRRSALCLMTAAMAVPASSAIALTQSDAEEFVRGAVTALRNLIDQGAEGEAGAAKFVALLEDKAALPQLGKFAVGRAWRSMSSSQKENYQSAFRSYVAQTYAKRFGDYAGEDIVVTGSVDAGRKGVLVKSELVRPSSAAIEIEWLVTDRLGPLKLADLLFEGVSLSITMRELFGSMLDKRNGDIDRFINDLAASEGA
ncbi:MAG: MlaC/ttg2D family ABC transporter substrate-binding protein [Pikeienuella sp.]